MSAEPRMTTRMTLRMPSPPATAIGHGPRSSYGAAAGAFDPVCGMTGRCCGARCANPIVATAHCSRRTNMRKLTVKVLRLLRCPASGILRSWIRSSGCKRICEPTNSYCGTGTGSACMVRASGRVLDSVQHHVVRIRGFLGIQRRDWPRLCLRGVVGRPVHGHRGLPCRRPVRL